MQSNVSLLVTCGVQCSQPMIVNANPCCFLQARIYLRVLHNDRNYCSHVLGQVLIYRMRQRNRRLRL